MATGNLKATIVQGKECGLLVSRLMVWKDGQLVLVKTHASDAGAMTQWLSIKANPARLPA